MRCLLRILLNAATGVSLVLCAATVVLWVRSFSTADWAWVRHDGVAWKAVSAGGHLVLVRANTGDLGSSLRPHGWEAFARRADGRGEAAALARTYDTAWSRLGLVAVRGPTTWQVNTGSTSTIYAECRSIWLPYWLVAALALVLPARRGPSVIRSMRSSRPSIGHCPACGYDLRASPERCPECGIIPVR
jgi:hypothetical protein